MCSHTPTVHLKTISWFPNIFLRMWPLIFCQHTIHQVIWPSPGTLAAVRNQVKRCQLPVAVRASFVFSSISVQSHFHPKNLIEMWITCLDQVSANSEKVRGSGWAVKPPPHNQICSRNWYAFSILKLTKFPPHYGGGFTCYYTKHFLNWFIPHVYRARPTHGPGFVWDYLYY